MREKRKKPTPPHLFTVGAPHPCGAPFSLPSFFFYPCLGAGICLETLSTMPISKSCIISADPP